MNKPDNILVDFDFENGRVINFEFVFSDWGTAGQEYVHFGGTPLYASPDCFHRSSMKDLFAFGRIASELCLDGQGS